MHRRNVFRVAAGVIQPYVVGFTESPCIQHFGRCVNDVNEPIVSVELHKRVAPIVQKLNSGEISEAKARLILKGL